MVEPLAPDRTLTADEPTCDLVLWNDWHAVARSQDLPSTTVLKIRLLDQDLVLWRNSQNQIAVWVNPCPHRGASLSTGRIVQDQLVCPYHGLMFTVDGQCVAIPAHPLSIPSKHICIRQRYWVQEQYELIFVCLGQPIQAIPQFPEWHQPGFRHFLCGPYAYQSSGLRAIENFFDIAHFPFVHDGLLGDPDHPEVNNYQVLQQGDDLLLRNVRFWQPDPDGTGEGRVIQNTYHIPRPLTVYFSKESPGRRLTIFFTVAPVAAEQCVGWMWFAMNYAHDVPEAELRAFQDKVVGEDLAIVESLQPRRLPLDLQAEFHLPCDRGSVAYRRWLSELGVTFGAIPDSVPKSQLPLQSSKDLSPHLSVSSGGGCNDS